MTTMTIMTAMTTMALILSTAGVSKAVEQQFAQHRRQKSKRGK